MELANYLRLGGFPALHLQKYSFDDAYTIVRDIYHSTIFTDIVRRNTIRKADQLERIVRFVLDVYKRQMLRCYLSGLGGALIFLCAGIFWLKKREIR